MNAPPKELSNWLGGGLIAAIGIGAVAGMIHLSGHAPFVLVPLAAGVSLGLILVALARRLRIADSKFVIFLAVVLACLTMFSQHAFIYGDFRRQWRESLHLPQVAMFRSESPPSMIQFFASEATPQQIGLWCLDAAIIIISTATTFWHSRRPQPPAPSP